METKEMYDSIQVKNSRLLWQSKRIKMLEDKMAELRKKYFQLKYADVVIH